MFNRFIFGMMVAFASTPLLAQTPSNTPAAPKANAYAANGNGSTLRSNDGLCWRTGYWTPEDSVTGCDGELLPPIAKPTAPAITPSPSMTNAQTPTNPLIPTPARCDFTIILEGDQIFASNKATLTKTAKNRIDSEALSKLNICATIDLILVSGHTDHLGTPQYNQTLSAKRAATVTAYLKSKGVSPAIETRGLGATQAIKICNNKLPYKDLAACLSPNRRVTIEVRGTAK